MFFTCILYLTIGPLFAIPRCATVSFTTGITPCSAMIRGNGSLCLFFGGVFALVLFSRCVREKSRYG
ncbi:MAG: branched-chain amino acid transport system II carrier protein [Oscillospiraceae bacterium]